MKNEVKPYKKEDNYIFSNNEINKVITGNWTAKEQDLFVVAMYKFQKDKEKIITIEKEELKGLGNFNSFNTAQFNKAIYDFSAKLGQTYIYQEDEERLKVQMLFESFEFSKRDGWLEITANDFLINALKDVEKGFFKFSLDESVFLKSKYSKILFRLLKQWRHTGTVTYETEELMRLLGSPKKYTVAKFREKILTPSVAELQDNFKGLRIHILRASDLGQSRRGNPVLKFKFTFQKEAQKRSFKKAKKAKDADKFDDKAVKKFKRAVKFAREDGIYVAKSVDLRKVTRKAKKND
jgi:Protein involved in initiation of plasmid replication